MALRWEETEPQASRGTVGLLSFVEWERCVFPPSTLGAVFFRKQEMLFYFGGNVYKIAVLGDVFHCSSGELVTFPSLCFKTSLLSPLQFLKKSAFVYICVNFFLFVGR